jgi:hypothetical protein
MRSFSLNSPEFYEAVCPREERPWIANGALPREPSWPRAPDGAWVAAEGDEDAEHALKSWLQHAAPAPLPSTDLPPLPRAGEGRGEGEGAKQ